MVTATYYAAVENSKFNLEADKADIFSHGEIPSEKIKQNLPIENYAAFFGEGIPLYDNSLIFADPNTYLGFVGDFSMIKVKFSEPVYIENGYTIVFDRTAPIKIDVYYGTNNALDVSVENLNKPLKWHIDSTLADTQVTEITFKLTREYEGEILTLKGITIGKSFEISDFFDFNQITEIRPLGDDLPMNQIQSTVYLADDFFSESGQKVVYFNNSNILEETFLSDSTAEQKEHFTLTSQSIIQKLSDSRSDYPFAASAEQGFAFWDELDVTPRKALEDIIDSDFSPSYIMPKWFDTYLLSQFLPPDSGRKLLQQIAWACCCGIKTDEKENTVEFVPFLATDYVVPDITISTADNRILKSKVTKGEVYNKIIWEYEEFTSNNSWEELGKITPVLVEGTDNECAYSFEQSTPFTFMGFEDGNFVAYSANQNSPYYIDGTIQMYEEQIAELKLLGYKYKSQKKRVEIDIPNKYGKTYTISNQTLYPLDLTKKIAQLKKWYSKNNTLSATVANNGDIEIGKILKLQLDNGSYFTGIITKIERKNISDYHTVDVEVHQWD